MRMLRLAAGLAALTVAVGACGSDEKSTTAAKTPPPTTSTGTLPEVKGRSSSKEKVAAGRADPEPSKTGDPVQVVDFLAFKTPSGKVGCAVTKDPTTLRCDTTYETSFSRSGHRCTEGDYGHSFEVLPTGAGKAICAGDTVLSATNAKTIPYGKTWLLGPFRCIARTTGLSCVNGANHGFSLSVESQRLF
jgi:hypothetical protein